MGLFQFAKSNQKSTSQLSSFSLSKFFAPSSANVWNKLKKQNTVGNLESVLIRNIFTHGVRLYITHQELWSEPPIASNKASKWGCIFISSPDPYLFIFFSSAHVKTLSWIVQMHSSTSLPGIHSNVNFYSQLIFSFILFLLLSSKWQIIVGKHKCIEETNAENKIYPCALNISILGS